MSFLPKVPYDLHGKQKDFLVALVRQLEGELRDRPHRQTDGAIYLSGDIRLRMVSPNGTVYEISVDDAGALVTTAVTL